MPGRGVYHQTSDAQLRIGESRDSGFDASHRPGMTKLAKRDYRSRGSSASRRPSPTRLNDSTTRKIAKPGHSAIHGALVRKRCAEFSMLPQDAAGGCCPSPRNDSAASLAVAAPLESVACTSSAGMILGSTVKA